MNELAVSIGVILFPGLVTTLICDKIASHSPKWGVFKYGVYSFVFGVFCYAGVQGIDVLWFWTEKLLCNSSKEPYFPLHVWTIDTLQKADINLKEVVYATLVSPIVAVFATTINNYKILNKISKIIRVSDKFGDENLFSYYLNSKEVLWVYIRDIGTNHTYKGRVFSWSETDNIQEIVLYDVTVYVYKSSKELYSLPSIYLAKPTGSFVIEAIPVEPLEHDDDEKSADK